jgi:hypothetical protein
MPTVEAVFVKGVPCCPSCMSPGTKYNDYGVAEQGFWFSFICQACSTKSSKQNIKYYTDGQFNRLSAAS